MAFLSSLVAVNLAFLMLLAYTSSAVSETAVVPVPETKEED